MKLKILGVCSLMSVFCLADTYADSEGLSDQEVTISKERVEAINKEFIDLAREIRKLNSDVGSFDNLLEEVMKSKESEESSSQSAEDIDEIKSEDVDEITLSEDFTFADSIDFLDKVKKSGRLTDGNIENIQKIFPKFKINQSIKSADDVTDSWWTQVFRQIWKVGITQFRTKVSQLHDKIKNFNVSNNDILKVGKSCFTDEQEYYKIFESKIFNTMLISDNGNRNSSDKKIELTKTWGSIRSKLYSNAKKAWDDIKEILEGEDKDGFDNALQRLRESVGELRSNVDRIISNPEIDELFGKKRPPQGQNQSKKKSKKNKEKQD